MKKLFFFLFLLPVCTLIAQQPDREYLQQFDAAEGEFISYEGPHIRIDSADAIREIGRILSREGDYAGKYTAFRLFTLDENYYSAHLLIPEAESTVDHIKNLRRIIAGYLEEEFAYTPEEADLLSVFITFYNAAYFGNIDHFLELYSEASASFLDAEICGLPLHFEQWPGGCQIVIPLRKKIGEKGDELDTEELTDDEVVSRMQDEPGKMIEERQDMVEFRQKELEEDKALIENAKVQETTTDEAIQQAEEAIQAEQSDIIEDRDIIADDQNEIIRAEEEEQIQKKGKTVHFILTQYSQGELVYGKMVNFDSVSRQIFAESTLNTIRSDSFIKSENDLIVIAGKEGDNTAVKLVALDSETLENRSESNETLSPQSPLIENGGKIYVIIKKDEQWYLGQYNQDLELENISEIPVFSGSAVLANGQYIYVQKSETEVERLNLSNLKISD